MNPNLMDAIRQQSDDLRDELKDLECWEEEMNKAEEAKRTRKVPLTSSSSVIEPPVRGSVSSLKQAIAEEAKRKGTLLPPEQDPIQLAKEKGNEFFRLGKTGDAINAYTQGINLDPNSATTHVLYGNRAMCHLKLGEWASAEADATKCVQLNRGYAKGYFRRAIARKKLGKLKDARSDLESVLALAPNDASALAELEDVTKKLQAERARGSAAAPPARKKIVIEEVEDEDEDEDEDGSQGEAKKAAATTPVADVAVREARIKKQLEELEEARRSSEAAKRAAVLAEEKAMESRRRRNPRVEVIEEEEEPEEKKTTAAAPRHVDPSPVSAAKREEAEAKGKKQPAPATTAAAAKKKSAAPTAVPVSRPCALPAKETLTVPKSFTEFEREFNAVTKNDELRDYYVGLLDPVSMVGMFGSNMTPEMLVGLLRSVKTMSASAAMNFMEGLSKVARVGELAMFFDSNEEKIVDNINTLVKSSGASEKEVAAVMGPFKPF